METKPANNQTLEKKLTILIFKCDSLDDLEYIEEKIKVTHKINRKTQAGRELTEKLLQTCNQQALKIIKEKQLIPFN